MQTLFYSHVIDLYIFFNVEPNEINMKQKQITFPKKILNSNSTTISNFP